MLSASSRSRCETFPRHAAAPLFSRAILQPAFLAVLVFPPPAAGADVLAGLDGARAGLATDGWEALGVQRIDGDGVLFDVALEMLEGPIGDRVDLDEVVLGVPGGERHLGALGRLIAAQARDPPGSSGERPVQGQHLADVAAGLAGLDGLAKAHDAVTGDELLDLSGHPET